MYLKLGKLGIYLGRDMPRCWRYCIYLHYGEAKDIGFLPCKYITLSFDLPSLRKEIIRYEDRSEVCSALWTGRNWRVVGLKFPYHFYHNWE